jgi:hypothetical protein
VGASTRITLAARKVQTVKSGAPVDSPGYRVIAEEYRVVVQYPADRCANMCSMRWDELKIDELERRELPGYRNPATVRTFDAPEALDVRFYEVRARSVLNKVPQASRMPFRWTVNPYRGCTHACVLSTASPGPPTST